MFEIISQAHKDPLGEMMLDYLRGSLDVYVEVDSSTLDMWTMKGETMFRSYSEMGELEQLALQKCEGRILDVGAGSGCHSLYFQEQGMRVDALDISPGCVEVMEKRKIRNVYHQNLFSLKKREYQTILMLMNGLGICGSLDGCNLFLQFIRTILKQGGQIIADSTDLSSLYNGVQRVDDTEDGYCGETEFIMRYNDISSDPFSWLYIDFNTLKNLVEYNGFHCEQIIKQKSGRFLVRIYSKP